MRRKFKESAALRIGIYVGVGVFSIVLGAVLSIMSDWVGLQGQAAFWGAVVGLNIIIIGLVAEVWLDIKRPPPPIEVIEGEAKIKQACKKIRDTEGAVEIRAVWCALYRDTKSYFKDEAKFLKESDVTIKRLINPVVVPPIDLNEFTTLSKQLGPGKYQLHRTSLEEMECYVCDYWKEDSLRVKALLIFIDSNRMPKLAIRIDPEREGSEAAAFAANSIKIWFDNLPKEQF